MHKKKLILFDLDGTLIKSMHFHFLSWQEVLKKNQINISEEDYYPLEGMSLYKIAKNFLEINNIKHNRKIINDIVNKKKRFYLSKVHKIQLYPFVKNTLIKIKKNKFYLGLVTSSHSIQVKHSLSSEILKLFDVIISGDMVKYNKPHPEPFLKAAKKLKILSKNCIVIENAPLGIISAKKAKMKCIAITNTNNKKILKDADFIIDKFKDLFNQKLL